MNNPPAFPQPIAIGADGNPVTSHNFDGYQSGITMRDWFAGMALQGMMANLGISASLGSDKTITDDTKLHRIRAQWSYSQADAMLLERQDLKS